MYRLHRLRIFVSLAFALIGGQALAGQSPAVQPTENNNPVFIQKVTPSQASVNTYPIKASTYFGGSGQDEGWPSTPCIIDAEGNIIFAILTYSSGLATPGSARPNYSAAGDVLVVKMDPQLTSVLCATYIGGNGKESAYGVGLDTDGRIYVGGSTFSSNFPVTAGVYDNVRAAEEGFIAIFSADLSTLVASTFVGGSNFDRIDDIAVAADASVFAIIWTGSTNLTATPGAIRTSYGGGAEDFFVVHLNSSLSAASAASYIGGNGDEFRSRLHLDGNGNIYIVGGSFSTNLPVTPGAIDSQNDDGSMDAFILLANEGLNTVLACTYLGGVNADWIYCVDLAADGDLYISGHVSEEWPVTTGCFDSTYGGPIEDDAGSDSYVSRISADLTTVKASTFLGGEGWDWGVDIIVDSLNNVYVVGETTSPDFPLTPDAYDKTRDTTEIFLAILDSTMSCLHMSTFIGGSGEDRWPGMVHDGEGEIYVLGYTESGGLTATPGAYDPSYNGAGDIYIASFNFEQFTRITEGPLVANSTRSSGICWIDYNGDGYLDLYETNAKYPVNENNRLYQNNGDGTFIEINDLAIVNDNNFSTSATWGDYDNDGDLDLFVAAHVTDLNLFYINNGDGTFTLNTPGPMAPSNIGSTTCSWVDYDNDGYLDLFIGNSTCSSCPGDYPPYRNFLFRNVNGVFSEITSGDIVTRENHTYGASWCDFDNDGDLDLVAPGSIYENDYCDLYRNDGAGDFVHLSSSVICQIQGIGGASSWADYDNDGDMDLFIEAYSPGPAPLFRNDGNGDFAEVTDHGLGLMLNQPVCGSWGDFDNDGDLDIFIWSNIYEFGSGYDSAVGYLYENNQGQFTQIPDTLLFSDSSLVAAAVWGDYDRDGDLDLYVPMFKLDQAGATNYFYRNNGNGNHWITVKCLGTNSNRSAIGARVWVKADIFGTSVRQTREITSQTVKCTQPPMEAHFGLGNATIVDSVRIEWPSGMVDVLTNVEVDQYLEVTETLCGDANGDGDANVGDAVYIINYVFKGGSAPNPEAAGDANCDNDCNVGDAVYLINYVFKGGPGPCAGC